MTCIVWHKDKLYADSMTVKDDEIFHSLTKINSYLTPFRIHSDKEGFVFDDRIHAWTGTGGNAAMFKFAAWLETESKNPEPSYTHIIAFYKLVAEQNLVNGMGNLFEIFFVGEQYNHSFRLDYTKGFSYHRFEKTETVFMGSAHSLCMQFMQEWEDPIRVMLEAFYIDPASGGMIEVWGWSEKHKADGVPLFRREGMTMDIPKEYLRHFLDKLTSTKTKIEPHFIRKGDSDVMLARAAKLNLELEETVAKQKRLLDQYRKRLGIGQAKKQTAKKKPAAKKAVKVLKLVKPEPLLVRVRDLPGRRSQNF